VTPTARECRDQFARGELAKPDYIRRLHETARHLFGYAELLPGTGVHRIELTPGGVQVVLADGARFEVDRDDIRQPQLEELYFGGFEGHEWEAVCRLIRPGMVVFDIGANIGWYTVRLARRFPTLAIHSFEPVPHTRGVFERNLALNPPAQVTVHPYGLSDRAGEATFHFSPTLTGGASAANILGLSDADKVTVRLDTLDAFCARTKLAPDFIKCDVEGGEFLVLQGGPETLRTAKPVVFLEMLRKWAAKFGYHPNDIIAFMAGHGYGCWEMTPTGPARIDRMTDETAGTNFLFLHAEAHADTIRGIAAR
jgi:FkbM family methyltransferase